jgi:hypothetical protein
VTLAGSRGIVVSFAYTNGLEEEIAFVFLPENLVKADILRWPGFESAVPPRYAAQILEGLEPLPDAGD